MDEYISKQSIIDYLNGYLHSIGEGGADSLLFDRGQRRALINSIQDISAVEAADVQPIKHGYWILQPEKFQIHEDVINSNYLYSCSCCNASDLHSERANNDGEVKFCWRCGARMDLKGGDTECHDTK